MSGAPPAKAPASAAVNPPAKSAAAPAKAKKEDAKQTEKKRSNLRMAALMFHPTNGRFLYQLETSDVANQTSVTVTPSILDAMAERVHQLGATSDDVYNRVAAEFGFDDTNAGAQLLVQHMSSSTVAVVSAPIAV